MRKGIIDRFEENFAVVEFDGSSENIPRVTLPKDCEVGDVHVIIDNKITVDKAETIKKEK